MDFDPMFPAGLLLACVVSRKLCLGYI